MSCIMGIVYRVTYFVVLCTYYPTHLSCTTSYSFWRWMWAENLRQRWIVFLRRWITLNNYAYKKPKKKPLNIQYSFESYAIYDFGCGRNVESNVVHCCTLNITYFHIFTIFSLHKHQTNTEFRIESKLFSHSLSIQTISEYNNYPGKIRIDWILSL